MFQNKINDIISHVTLNTINNIVLPLKDPVGSVAKPVINEKEM